MGQDTTPRRCYETHPHPRSSHTDDFSVSMTWPPNSCVTWMLQSLRKMVASSAPLQTLQNLLTFCPALSHLTPIMLPQSTLHP
uniref:Uncharacterized protein n=1 Tax=Chrysemys picta bellii TaxID=8478 RepID=A0A8C3I5T8_CHRPI